MYPQQLEKAALVFPLYPSKERLSPLQSLSEASENPPVDA